MARPRGYVVPKVLSVWEQEELRVREEDKRKRAEEKQATERQAAWDRRFGREKDRNSFSFRNFVEASVAMGQHWPENLMMNGRVLAPYKFFQKKQVRSEFPCEPVIQAWHGTPIHNLAKIAKYSLKAGSGSCLYGSGIYVTRDVQKALHYGRDGDVVVLLRCTVAVGTTYYPQTSGDKSSVVGLDKEYQSVYTARNSLVQGAWGGMVRGEEFVVYDSSQVEVTEIYVWKQQRRDALPPKNPPKNRVSDKQRRLEHRRRKDEHRPKVLVPTTPCQRVVDGKLCLCKNTYTKWSKDKTVGYQKCILGHDVKQSQWCSAWEKSDK